MTDFYSNPWTTPSHPPQPPPPLHSIILCWIGTLFNVHVTTSFVMSCSCLYEREHLRPCGHIAAAMLRSDHDYDVWDIRWFGKEWHTSTWRSQYTHKLKRVAMKPMDCTQRELVPAMLCATPGSSTPPRVCCKSSPVSRCHNAHTNCHNVLFPYDNAKTFPVTTCPALYTPYPKSCITHP